MSAQLLSGLGAVLLAQVGPNPNAADTLGLPDELANRPERAENGTVDPASIWLAQCLAQIADNPARAHSQAQIEASQTTGEQRVLANHCLGLAATQLALWDNAKAAFLEAREYTPADELSARARFAVLAGNAALALGDWEGALETFALGKTDAQTAASASLEAVAARDSARALVALEREGEALEALRTATSLTPDDSEAWLLTATLLRRTGALGEAQSAIERAITLDPQNPAIGLEAGAIAVLSGRDGAAEQSWRSVIATAPQSEEAASARAYLAQLGVDIAPKESGLQPDQEPPEEPARTPR